MILSSLSSSLCMSFFNSVVVSFSALASILASLSFSAFEFRI